MLHHVDTMVAAIGPAGVAFHTHHTVATFHNISVSNPQPSIEKHSLHDGPYCALISNNGTKPTNIVMQLAPSQGIASNIADAILNAIFVLVGNVRLN